MTDAVGRTITFTGEQLVQVRAALVERDAETRHYLVSYGGDDWHDDCCPRAAARAAWRQGELDALTRRLAVVGECLELTGPQGAP